MKLKNILFSLFFLSLPSNILSNEVIAIQKLAYEDPYSIINKVTIINSDNDEIRFKIFETGGHDRAMNGNKLVLNIMQWDVEGNIYTWETGIDLYVVNTINIKDMKIIIEGSEHILDDKSYKLIIVPVSYIIEYYFDDNKYLKNNINIKKIKI